MSAIGLITWILTASLGLYLLSIWLIEYDRDFQTAASTRLPVPVLTSHVLVAGGGLLLWIGYLIWDNDRLAWYSVIALVLAATLGLTMAIRWVSVYRAKRVSLRAAANYLATPVTAGVYPSGPAADPGPPERNFPLPVVVAHGVFAVATLTIVLLTALGVGGS
jgi:hypothetical protein